MQLCACAFLHLGRSLCHGGDISVDGGIFHWGELLEGEGEGVGAFRHWRCVFCLYFWFMWMLGGLFFCLGGGGGCGGFPFFIKKPLKN